MKDPNPYLSLMTVMALALLLAIPDGGALETRLAREFEKVKAERLIAPRHLLK